MNASGAALRVEIHLPLPQFQLECSFEAQNEVVVLFGVLRRGQDLGARLYRRISHAASRPDCAGRSHCFLQ